MIVAPFAGSPAEEAGILGGEQLWAVDGIAVDSLTRDEAGALLRGPIGSMVSHLLPLISFLPNKHLQVTFWAVGNSFSSRVTFTQ
jgi:predicted metalloprotease with PDZ domain